MTPDAVKTCAGGNAHLTTTKWKDEPIAPQLVLDENDAVLRIVQKTVKALSTDDAHRSETESIQNLRKQKIEQNRTHLPVRYLRSSVRKWYSRIGRLSQETVAAAVNDAEGDDDVVV